MTAELHVVGGDRHVLVDRAGLDALRSTSAPPEPWMQLTGAAGDLAAIPVYRGRCPCMED